MDLEQFVADNGVPRGLRGLLDKELVDGPDGSKVLARSAILMGRERGRSWATIAKWLAVELDRKITPEHLRRLIMEG